jgi:hypothetical protein
MIFWDKFVMTSETNFDFAYVTPEPIQMTPGEAFTNLKAKFMTPALQAKSDLFDELGCYTTEDFIYIKKNQLALIQVDVNRIKPMKFKPRKVSYLLALIDWLSFGHYGCSPNTMPRG